MDTEHQRVPNLPRAGPEASLEPETPFLESLSPKRFSAFCSSNNDSSCLRSLDEFSHSQRAESNTP
ncbi:hypothetical protein T4E_11933 [Trichinella pseudospiralis]|uniref:Uncharacterized protein n=1 Tax=Trichinella pseudospiralis TaxID=6337 RepID=A0A0V0YNA5_TRIPS|nr:hypothetical protein T4E_11933 [Trichinella pseudospiralis]